MKSVQNILRKIALAVFFLLGLIEVISLFILPNFGGIPTKIFMSYVSFRFAFYFYELEYIDHFRASGWKKFLIYTTELFICFIIGIIIYTLLELRDEDYALFIIYGLFIILSLALRSDKVARWFVKKDKIEYVGSEKVEDTKSDDHETVCFEKTKIEL